MTSGFVFLAYFGFGICVYVIAQKKGRNPVPWLVYYAFLPYIALPHIAMTGRGSSFVAQPKQIGADPAELQRRLEAIESGNLPTFKPQGIMLRPGETFFYEQAAQQGQKVVDSKVVGRSAGVGVPIGGVLFSFGGSSGEMQHTERLQWGPQGRVLASNQRLIFTAGADGMLSIPYSSILNFEAAEKGCAITTSDAGSHRFYTGDQCFGVLLQRIVDSIHGGTQYAALEN